MLKLDSDYMEGCHPNILEKLAEINFEKNAGYGTDGYSKSAKEKILKACGLENGDVYFISGGTQANMTIISSILKPYESVVAVESGHISTHEAGAIEATGHKVSTISGVDGKMEAKNLSKFLKDFNDDENNEHTVFPKLVYISMPTEFGTIYSKRELEEIYNVCQKYNVYLMVDGARLGYGLVCDECDMDISFLANSCDIFYIGGTKVGALFGEAIVMKEKDFIPHFKTMIKQRGALLAKGWLLGLQFDVLFSDNLYFKIAENAIDKAKKLKKIFIEKGYKLYINSPTNQIFVIIENEKIKKLRENVSFSFWEKYDGKSSIVRFVTSWATKDEEIEKLEKYL